MQSLVTQLSYIFIQGFNYNLKLATWNEPGEFGICWQTKLQSPKLFEYWFEIAVLSNMYSFLVVKIALSRYDLFLSSGLLNIFTIQA